MTYVQTLVERAKRIAKASAELNDNDSAKFDAIYDDYSDELLLCDFVDNGFAVPTETFAARLTELEGRLGIAPTVKVKCCLCNHIESHPTEDDAIHTGWTTGFFVAQPTSDEDISVSGHVCPKCVQSMLTLHSNLGYYLNVAGVDLPQLETPPQADAVV